MAVWSFRAGFQHFGDKHDRHLDSLVFARYAAK